MDRAGTNAASPKGWLQRVAGMLRSENGSSSGSAENKPAEATKELQPVSLCECRGCKKRIGRSIGRCPHCGTKSQVGKSSQAAGARQDGPQSDEAAKVSAGLNEIHKRILIAALNGTGDDSKVYLLGSLDSQHKEVKAGDRRLIGEEALDAVTDLLNTGYLQRAEDRGFGLSQEGRRVAALLWNG